MAKGEDRERKCFNKHNCKVNIVLYCVKEWEEQRG
jgi:hypothetical protein